MKNPLPQILSILCFLLFTTTIKGQADTIATFSNLSIDSMGHFKWMVNCNQEVSASKINISIERLNGSKWELVRTAWRYGSVITATKGFSNSSSTSKTSTAQTSSTKPSLNKPRFKTKTDSTNLELDKGMNTFRLNMTGPCHGISAEVKVFCKISTKDFFWIMGSKMYLQNAQAYEILNDGAASILKGEGKEIDLSTLKKGSYFLYTKGKTLPFEKQ